MLCGFIVSSSSSLLIPTSLTSKMQHRQDIDRRRSVVVELPLEDGAAFDLEKAVCSHGLFMMAPNRWDSLTKTLERPLRLSKNINDDDHEQSLLVRISQPSDSPHSFSVFSGQVRRLVRLSVEENKRLSGYLWRSKGEGIWECV